MVTQTAWRDVTALYDDAVRKLEEGAADDELEAAVGRYLDASVGTLDAKGLPGIAEVVGEGPDDLPRAALAAADLDIALRLLESMDRSRGMSPGTNGSPLGLAAGSGRSPLDLGSVSVARPAAPAFAAGVDEFAAGVDELAANKDALVTAVDGCYDGVLKAAAAVMEDIAGLIATIGAGKVLNAAGALATAALETVPAQVRWFVDKAVKAIQAAVDKLRAFFANHAPDVERKVTKWFSDTVGAEGFTERVLARAGDVERLKAERKATINALPDDGPAYADAVTNLTALGDDFDSGDAWVSTAVGLTSKAWPVLMSVLGTNAPLVGGVAAAALLTFTILRLGDYLDWDGVGTLRMPMVDEVPGPRRIVDALVAA
jgi:hypothetical protein